MPEHIPEKEPDHLGEEVGAKEQRKLEAERQRHRTVWFGLGMFGLIGWSVAIPTLLGVLLGIWLDRVAPGRGSWTLTLLLAGVVVGCFHAWYWLARQQRQIDTDGSRRKDG